MFFDFRLFNQNPKPKNQKPKTKNPKTKNPKTPRSLKYRPLAQSNKPEHQSRQVGKTLSQIE